MNVISSATSTSGFARDVHSELNDHFNQLNSQVDNGLMG